MKRKTNKIYENTKYKKIVFILVLAFFSLFLLVFMSKKNIMQIQKKEQMEEETVRDIIFEPYSNSDGKLELLVIVQDLEYNIVSLKYEDKNREMIELTTKKNKIAIDYETRSIWRI